MNTIELKHTPGPWYAVVYGGYQILHTAPCYGNKDLLDSDEVGPELATSNGVLCAAAPLLLSALIGMIKAWDKFSDAPEVFAWYQDAQDALAAAGVTITEDAKTTQP